MDTYEKKYNEALSQARFYYGNCPTEPEKEKLEKLFPELRESEDERIRQKLMWLLQQDICPFPEEEVAQMLNYLEKQKEQKPTISDEAIREGIVHFGITQYQIDNWLKKHINIIEQKEQKPNYCHYGGDPNVERCKYCSAACSARLTEEQKPAEKQDYSGLSDLEQAIHRGFLCAGVENVPVTIIKETAKDCLAQIKPAEWSEEDEKIRNLAIEWAETMYGQFRFVDMGSTDFRKIVDWLKSLRPQPHWKPSKEQIRALKFAVDKWENGQGASPSSFKSYLVKDLYEQLKKLM